MECEGRHELPGKDAQAELLRTRQALQSLTEEIESRVADRTLEARQAQEAAESAADAKSMFLATMSHEMRTPLNAILGLCHLASHTTPLSGHQRTYLNQIQTAAHTLLKLVNDNLDLTRIEAGVYATTPVNLRLGLVCQELIHLLRQKAEAKGLALRIEWEPGVPQFIKGDPDRLRQVLVNLADNAAKYTPEGEVRIVFKWEAGTLRVEVKDTGPGLEESELSTLFTPFARHQRQGEGAGLGLTLSRRLVDLMGGEMGVESVKGQGCTFWVTLPALSLVAEGRSENLPSALVVEPQDSQREAFAASLRPFVAHVTALASMGAAQAHLASLRAAKAPFPELIFVPHGAPRLQRLLAVPATSLIYRVAPSSTRRAQTAVAQGWIRDFLVTPGDSPRILDLFQGHAGPEPPTLRFQGHPRILLVEDNGANRMVTAELLEKAGCLVEEAEDGQKAVDAVLAEDGAFAAILMDLELPDMDGLEATRRIRALKGRELPILAVTAHLLRKEHARCMEAGMDDFLSKPVDPEVLYQALERVIAPRRDVGRQPAPVQPPSIRWDFLNGRINGNAELMRRVLLQFRREASSLRVRMRMAMDAGEVAAIPPLAHALAGAASNIGADPVLQATYRLHRAPSASNLQILEQAVDRLVDDLDSLDLGAPLEKGARGLFTREDLARLRALLARRSLEACALLQPLREELLHRGLADKALALGEAQEELNFARAQTLLESLDVLLGESHASQAHGPDRR